MAVPGRGEDVPGGDEQRGDDRTEHEAWNDADEPWVQVASWHRGAFTHARHAPAAIEPVVGEDLSGRSVLRSSMLTSSRTRSP